MSAPSLAVRVLHVGVEVGVAAEDDGPALAVLGDVARRAARSPSAWRAWSARAAARLAVQVVEVDHRAVGQRRGGSAGSPSSPGSPPRRRRSCRSRRSSRSTGPGRCSVIGKTGQDAEAVADLGRRAATSVSRPTASGPGWRSVAVLAGWRRRAAGRGRPVTAYGATQGRPRAGRPGAAPSRSAGARHRSRPLHLARCGGTRGGGSGRPRARRPPPPRSRSPR